MQGLVGGIAGALLGVLAAFTVSLMRFGLSSAAYLPWTGLGTSILYAICTGTLLSLVGVLYPAIVASRMQPVEAMRVEQ